MLHTLFSAIETADDIDPAIERLIFEGVIRDQEKEDTVREVVQKAFSSPEIQDWYSGRWQLFNECAIIYKEDFLSAKKILKKYESTKILTYLFIFTAIILLPSLYLERNMYVLNQVSLKAILSLIYMGLFSSLIAFLLQQKGIKKIGPVKASIYTNLIPIYSIILSSLILKERVTLIQIIAMILVMLAIIINMETKKDKKIDK